MYLLKLGSATVFMFGRGVVAIVQGTIGMLSAMEGYYGVRTMNKKSVSIVSTFGKLI